MHKLMITKFDGATGVVLPQKVLDDLRVAPGGNVYLLESPSGFRLTSLSKDTAEQLEAADYFMTEYSDALKELAKR